MAAIEKRINRSWKVIVERTEARRVAALRASGQIGSNGEDFPLRLNCAMASKAEADAVIGRYKDLGIAGASIKEFTSTAYQVRIRMKGAPRITKTFRTRAMAEAWKREKEGEIEKRSFVDYREAEGNTLGDLLRRYDTDFRAHRAETDPDRVRLRILATRPMAALPMSALTPADLCEYRDARLKGSVEEAPVKGTTVKKELELVARVIAIAMREWRLHLAFNPASGERVARPAAQPGDERDRRLEREYVPLLGLAVTGDDSALQKGRRAAPDEEFGRDPEIEALLAMPQPEQQALLRSARYPRWFTERKKSVTDATLKRRAAIKAKPRPKARLAQPGCRTWAILSFAIETAMRRGELCKLRWTDVHLDDGYVLLKSAITKNGKSRIVPLSLRAKRILATQPKRSEFVFAVTPEAIKSAFRRARARVGIVDLRKHDLRHEATSRLFVETNLRPSEIGQITGHTDPRMLERYNNTRPHELVERFNSSRRAR